MTNDFLQPSQNYNQTIWNKTSIYKKPQFNEILVITNTIQKRKRKIIYLNITNKCQHVSQI